MRKLLLALVLALLVGAALMWLMQQGTGYLLIGFADTSIEMSLWVAGLLFVLFTFALLWLLLLTRWVISAGGFSRWWNSRRNAKQLGKTAQGLLLYADQDWSKASEMLAGSAQLSSMSQVNLLFAAQAAANNKDIDGAGELLQCLKDSYPASEPAAIKAEVELLVNNQQLAQALRKLQPLHRDRPTDTGVLRQLMNIYCLQRDWNSAQKLLRDFKHYGSPSKQGAAALEIKVYSGLFADFVASPDLNKTGQYNQLAELWELVPKALRKTPELVVPFADALAQINATERLLPLLGKALHSHWHPDLIERFGALPVSNPEKQLAMAEKWLPSHSEDANLLLALGRICRRLEYMGKARDYLSTAIKLDPRPQTFLEMAQVLHILGETEASADMYRQGLEVGLVE